MNQTKKALQPINKHTVLKQVRDLGKWEGYIAPNKLSGSHVNSGWHIGSPITIIKHAENNQPYVLSVNEEGVEKLETYLNNYKYYNCNVELGNRIRFWQ